MGYFYIVITIFMALGSWWAGSKAWEEFSTGDLYGVVTLEDKANADQVQIEVRFKGEVVNRTFPDVGGRYQMSIKTGAYSILFRASGYESEEAPVSIQSGNTPVPKMTLKVLPKSVGILLVDKRDQPYPNFDMQLSLRDPGGAMSKAISELHFNQYGQAQTSKLEFGQYDLILMSPVTDYRKFLWVDGKSLNAYPGFILKAKDDSYKVILPRVLHAEQSGPNTAPTYTPANDHYFGQAFILAQDISVCGVGFGIGIGGNGVPTTLQIRDSSGENPGERIILEVRPHGFSASLSDVRSGSFGNSCDEGIATVLKAGTYWVVAKYDFTPKAISLLGGPGLSSGKLPLKKSSDGKSWEIFSFSGIEMLDVFLTE